MLGSHGGVTGVKSCRTSHERGGDSHVEVVGSGEESYGSGRKLQGSGGELQGSCGVWVWLASEQQ